MCIGSSGGIIMKKKERLVGLIMAVVMSAAMGLIAAFLVRLGMNPQELASSPPAAVMYISNILESIAFGVIFTLILPMGRWGHQLASKAGAVPPSLKFHLLNSLPVSMACAILVSAPVCFINILQARAHMPPEVMPPLMPMFLGSWLKLLLPTAIIGYVISLFISPIVVKAVGLNVPSKRPPNIPERNE
jgi:hypothetical protein